MGEGAVGDKADQAAQERDAGHNFVGQFIGNDITTRLHSQVIGVEQVGVGMVEGGVEAIEQRRRVWALLDNESSSRSSSMARSIGLSRR